MKLTKILSLALTASLIAGLGVSPAKADNSLFSAKFDFGNTETKLGYTQVSSKDTFSDSVGYGFTSIDGLSDGGSTSPDELQGDYVTSSTGEINFAVAVPDGDYEVKMLNGGETETEVNIYINEGERVRVFKVEAGKYQENTQRVLPKDGKITFQFKGASIKVNSIEVNQLPNRTNKADSPTIYIAGDSTAQTYNIAKTYPQTGWGQVFADYCTDGVKIENRSMGGRSLKSYNNDGRLDNILTAINPGDYILIQFGHNDGSSKPERFISVDDFKVLLRDKYINETIKRGAIPIILTPTPHFSPDENGKFAPTILNYSQAALEVAEETGAIGIDVQAKIAERWNELGADKVRLCYFINEQGESVAYPDGTDDHTHFKEAGAREVAQVVAKSLYENVPELSKLIYAGDNKISFTDINKHWAEDIIKSAVDTGIVVGISKTEFAPEKEVTRAEFLKMAMRAGNINGKAWRDAECYNDITADDWFRFDVQGAKDKNIIPSSMIVDNKFNGNTPITREEMAAIIVNVYDFVNPDSKLSITNDNQTLANLVFKDYDSVSSWAKDSIIKAYNSKLISGSKEADGLLLAPYRTATRAEAATIINRYMTTEK